MTTTHSRLTRITTIPAPRTAVAMPPMAYAVGTTPEYRSALRSLLRARGEMTTPCQEDPECWEYQLDREPTASEGRMLRLEAATYGCTTCPLMSRECERFRIANEGITYGKAAGVIAGRVVEP